MAAPAASGELSLFVAGSASSLLADAAEPSGAAPEGAADGGSGGAEQQQEQEQQQQQADKQREGRRGRAEQWVTTVDLCPHTGRMHQLRRHMALIGGWGAL